MKQEKMIRYMNLIDSKYIAEANPANAKNIAKRKSRTNLILRYGALAASFVLVVGVLLAMPYLRHDDPVFPDQTDNPHDSTGPIEDTSNHGSESTDTEPVTDRPIIGGSLECVHTVYDRSYHQIDGHLIEYVVRIYGQEAYDNWGVERRKEINLAPDESFDYCSNFTIVDYVEDFNIPREVFEALNDNYLSCRYDYNLDAIYAGKEVAEAYYRSDRSQVVLERKFLRNIKGQLKLYVETQDAEAITNWINEKNATEWGFSEATRSHIEIPGYGYSDEFRGGYSQYSIKEFIDYFDIPRDVVEEIYLRCWNPALEGELDIDALFEADNGSNDSDRTDKKPLDIDRSYIVYKTDNSAE